MSEKKNRRGENLTREHQQAAGRERMAQLGPDGRKELARQGYNALLEKYGETRVKKIMKRAGEHSYRKQQAEAVQRGEYPNQVGYWNRPYLCPREEIDF